MTDLPAAGTCGAGLLAAGLLAAAVAAAVGACDRAPPRAAAPAAPRGAAALPSSPTPRRVTPPPLPATDLRLEVDTRARRLHVVRHDSALAVYPVAVGSPAWPTRRGVWSVVQVIWNPEWRPPPERWAAGLARHGPGDPDNPLGRVQLVYDPPRTIHGTNMPASIGKAVSHGSIRMGDAAITRLARDVMEAAGVGRDAAWVARVLAHRHEKLIVDLPRVVPIRVY